MSTTWVRSRLGGSQSSGENAFLWLLAFTNSVGQAQTLRRVVAQWGVDIEGLSTQAVANSQTPMSLGIVLQTQAGGTPVAPTFSPTNGLENQFYWWQGIWYGANYGALTEEGGVVGFSANGTIDAKSNRLFNPAVQTSVWIGVGIEDAHPDWQKFFLIAWTSVLVGDSVS